MRVILVGETSIDAQLRRDVSLEVVKASSVIEALGQVWKKTPEGKPCVVVVAPDAASNGVHSSAGTLSPLTLPLPTDFGAFIKGLRGLNSAVRVIRFGKSDVADGQFDACVGAGDVDSLLRVIRGEPESEPELELPATPAAAARVAPVPPIDPSSALAEALASEDSHQQPEIVVPPSRPTPPVAVRPTPAAIPASASAPSATEVGDVAMVQALIRGMSLIDTALELISHRLGVTVRFSPHGGEAPMGPSVGIAWEGHLFGHLCAMADPARLEPHAMWLASWLHLKESQARLRRAALTDPLTGAWNRRYFDRFLASAISIARVKRQHVNVLLFDIDDFKRYNDEFGHGAGDEILVEAVKLMRSVIRPTDRVCRIGGDEFAVIFHDPDGPRVKGSRDSVSTVELANRFRKQILEHKFPKLGALARGTLTISGGMAAFPWDGSNAVDLLSRADELARESKASGKNVITFGPGALRSGHDDVSHDDHDGREHHEDTRDDVE